MAIPPGPGDQTGTSIPTCFRHPGRETYVSCVRCGRACPDCLRSAAVGQQCVDCIRDANRGTRRPSGTFGGRLATGGAVLTWTLVALNVAAYLAEIVYPKTVDYGQLLGGAYDPALREFAGVALGDWYRLLTNAFLHEPPGDGIGILHIAFNMWALIVVGPSLERVLGRGRFLAVYLISALAGSAFYYLLAPLNAPALGASGAIFGLFGAWFVLSRRLRVDSRQIILLIVLNLVISFTISGIAWQAHVGGLVAGTALTAAFVYPPRQRRLAAGIAATLAMLVIIVAMVVIRDNQVVHQVLIRF